MDEFWAGFVVNYISHDTINVSIFTAVDCVITYIYTTIHFPYISGL